MGLSCRHSFIYLNIKSNIVQPATPIFLNMADMYMNFLRMGKIAYLCLK